MSESSFRSSEYDAPNGEDDEQSNYQEITPRSTARRTMRNRIPRQQTAGMLSDSDFSEEDESPRKTLRKGTGKKGGKPAQQLRDESGRPLTPAEARRQRKRITNRESARRMRLLRKEEWNNLQQEVHDKTTELQKVHAINRRMNEGYAALDLKFRNVQQHNALLVAEIVDLVDHLRENLGKEIDNRRLAVFLRNMAQLLPPQHAPHGLNVWVPSDSKQLMHDEGKSQGGRTLKPSQIHITANGTSAAYNSMQMTRSASAPEPPHGHFSPDGGSKRQRGDRSGGPAGSPISPERRPPLHPGRAATGGLDRGLLPSMESFALEQPSRPRSSEPSHPDGKMRMGSSQGMLGPELAPELPLLGNIKCESDAVLLINMPDTPVMHASGHHPGSGSAMDMQRTSSPEIPPPHADDHRPVTAPVIGLDGTTGSGDFALPSLSSFPSLDEQLRKQMSVEGLEKQISLGRLIGMDFLEP